MNPFWTEFNTVLVAVLPVFCAAVAGIIMRRKNWLSEEADQSLLRVTINLLVPCLIFDSMLKNKALRELGNVLLAPVIGFGTVAVGMGLAWACGRLAGLQNRKQIGTFALCVGLYNYGYVPLPLAKALFHSETVGVLFVHNFGVEVAMWTLGLMLLQPKEASSGWRKLLNAPVVAILLALLLNCTGAYQYVPEFIYRTLNMLGQCAIPMGLILIGAIMDDHLPEFGSGRAGKVMVVACALRMAILPMGFLLLAKYLPCTRELKQVMVLQAAMPAAVFPIVMSKHYGGDPPTALRVVVGTSVVGLLTIPLWIRFGMSFVGL